MKVEIRDIDNEDIIRFLNFYSPCELFDLHFGENHKHTVACDEIDDIVKKAYELGKRTQLIELSKSYSLRVLTSI
tara:strand:- start:514 stop:738 length:225 start_codon:yes stop_codon:yes gene_type:complete